MILPAWGNSLFVSVTVTGFLSAVDNVCCPMLMCFGFSVKIFSEVTHNRNTQSPSMQSFGGYRTDHGGFFKVLQTELVFGFFLSIFWEIKMKWQKNNTTMQTIIIYMYGCCFFSMFSLQKRQDRHFGFFSALYYNNACIVFCATSAVLRQMVKVVSKAGRFLTIVCPSWLVFKECLHGHDLHRKPLFWDINVLFFILKSFFLLHVLLWSLSSAEKKSRLWDCF